MGLMANDRVQVTLRGKCFGQRIVCVRTLLIVGDMPVADSVKKGLDDILTAINIGGIANWIGPYLACLPPQYTLNEMRAQRIKPVRSAYTSLFPINFIGTNVNNATVSNDSAALTFRGANASRSNVGTVKVGPAPDGASAAGLLTAAYTNLMSALGAAMSVGFAVDGAFCIPVLYNKKLNTVESIESFRVGAESRTMRRRTVGIGE